MANFLKSLDWQILEFHQGIADWIDMKTGRNCFSLAETAALLTILVMFYPAATLVAHGKANLFGFVLTSAVILYLYRLSKILIEVAEESIRQGKSKNRFESAWIVRLAFVIPGLVLSILNLELSVLRTLDLFLSIFAVLYTYFLCCTPLPPSAKKREELLDAAREAL
jgi:hypothetical protein